MDEKAQTSPEYLLLIAFGMIIVLGGIVVAIQIKAISDVISNRVTNDRNSTITMITGG